MDWDRHCRPAVRSGPAASSRHANDQVPLRINVRTVQIRLRVWDSKNNTARQMTIIQEI